MVCSSRCYLTRGRCARRWNRRRCPGREPIARLALKAGSGRVRVTNPSAGRFAHETRAASLELHVWRPDVRAGVEAHRDRRRWRGCRVRPSVRHGPLLPDPARRAGGQRDVRGVHGRSSGPVPVSSWAAAARRRPCGADPDSTKRLLEILGEHCKREGRDYASIEKTMVTRFDPGPSGERADQRSSGWAGSPRSACRRRWGTWWAVRTRAS